MNLDSAWHVNRILAQSCLSELQSGRVATCDIDVTFLQRWGQNCSQAIAIVCGLEILKQKYGDHTTVNAHWSAKKPGQKVRIWVQQKSSKQWICKGGSMIVAPNHQFRILLFPSAVGIMYILSSKRSPNPGWHLALTSATTALECIWCASTNIGELVSFLVQSGRAFKTHHSCDQIPLSIYHYSPPIIRSSYQSALQLPTIQEDYTYYEETCTNFLSLPQAHTALLQGSIVWHLTIKVMGDCAEDIVLNGPLDDVLKFGSKICCNGNEFWDNRLNEAEMDLICGVYKLYSKCQTPIVDIL